MRHARLAAILVAFACLAAFFGSIPLDNDEFGFIREPYEMLGGDYTLGYLRAHEWANAMGCAARSYAFFWRYRPLYSPIVSARDRRLFAVEEGRFGYVRPDSSGLHDARHYARRVVAPEPDRFYAHGAGQPLLNQLLRIPATALTYLVMPDRGRLLEKQFRGESDPVFILPRLQGILAGLACIVLVYVILLRESSRGTALLGAGLLALLPPAIMFFPNIHFDAVLAPFVLAAGYLFVRDRHALGGVCFGLALAAKNTAVFLLPALVLYVVAEVVRRAREEGRAGAMAFLRQKVLGLTWFVAIGIVALTPFADPISVFREMITPVVSRPFDPRGEDITRFRLVSHGPGAAGDFVKAVLGYNFNLLFVLVGVPLLWGRLGSPMARLAFFMLIVSFVYRPIYGDGLLYRSLMFLPFFAVLAAPLLRRPAAAALIVGLLVVDAAFMLDPVGATGVRRGPPVPARGVAEVASGSPGAMGTPMPQGAAFPAAPAPDDRVPR